MRSRGALFAALLLFAVLGSSVGGGADASSILSPSLRGVASLAVSSALPAAFAATHLRVNVAQGFVEELPEKKVRGDGIKYHHPIQHPGTPSRPRAIEPDSGKLIHAGQWHSWTSLGPTSVGWQRPRPSGAPSVAGGTSDVDASGGGAKRLRPEPGLAVLFDRHGGVDNALVTLTRATRENPNDPVMWSDLGNVYRVKGDVDLAIECFDNAIRLQPHPDFYLNLGNVRMFIQEEDEAIRLFTLGLQLNPRHVLLQYSIGNAYAAQGRPEEAARALEAAIRIDPGFKAAEARLKEIIAEMRGVLAPGRTSVALFFVILVACFAAQRVVQYFAMSASAEALAARRENVERFGPAIGAAFNVMGVTPTRMNGHASIPGLRHRGRHGGGHRRHH